MHRIKEGVVRVGVASLCLLFALNGFSQHAKGLSFGARIGAGYSSITSLAGMLVPENYYSNYRFSANGYYAPEASLFVSYHVWQAPVAIEFNVNYYQLGTGLHYNDTYNLKYSVDFQYHYIAPALYVKAYPLLGLYLGVGSRIGFNLASNGLAYTSNQEEERFNQWRYPTVKETDGHLKSKLIGQHDVALGGIVGYDLPLGLSLHLSYHYSISDLIATRLNNFRWAETKNRGHALSFCVGWAFSTNR